MCPSQLIGLNIFPYTLGWSKEQFLFFFFRGLAFSDMTRWATYIPGGWLNSAQVCDLNITVLWRASPRVQLLQTLSVKRVQHLSYGVRSLTLCDTLGQSY